MENMQPFNVSLLFATQEDIRGMLPIDVLDIKEGMTNNFHPRGLFSTEIFGKPGSEYRNRIHAYINLNIDIIHPHLYTTVLKMKSLYAEVLMGRAFAVFDPKLQDLVPAREIDGGQTGYNFFFEHYPKIKYEERESRARRNNIKLLYKYRNNYTIDKLIVLPAGLRDYVVDENNRPSEDEINPLYRRVMNFASSLESYKRGQNVEFLDPTRLNLQKAVQAIYEHLLNMLKGKKGIIQQHFSTRSLMNSTRNVLVAYTPKVEYIGDPRSVSANQTIIGLYQFLRAFIPFCVKNVRERFSSNVFPTMTGTANLINPKTLKRETVTVGSEHQELWMTYDGLEKVFSSFGDYYLRHRDLRIEGYYMGLLYDDGKTVRMFFDIDELPEHFNREFVRPINLTEMLYYCVHDIAKDAYGFVTRFPVAGYGGVYPSGVYLRSTVVSRIVQQLDESWNPIEGSLIVEFPNRGISFFDAMCPAVVHLAALGGDHDGDTGSFTGVWTQEGREEIHSLLYSDWTYYISARGKMSFSYADDILKFVVGSMTKKVNHG